MEVPLNARAALLQALTHPGHGIELIRRIAKRTHGRVRLRQGSVYRALKQIERRGLAKAVTVPSGGAGRPRRRYALTLDGVVAAAVERHALLGLLATQPIARPSADEVDLMRRRIRLCAEVSAFVLE